MVELDQIKSELGNLAGPLAELEASLGVNEKEQRIEELRREMEAPDFWDDNIRAQNMTKELKDLRQYDQRAQSPAFRYRRTCVDGIRGKRCFDDTGYTG